MHHHLLAVLAALITTSAAATEPIASKQGTFCWKMNYGGVVLGISTDANVVRLLGAGAHRPKEEDGARYYVDIKRKATMRVATFTDSVVGEVSIEQGVAPTLRPAERRGATAQGFRLEEKFGNWHALSLGATKEEVTQNLGPAARTEGVDVWIYDAACTCELPEFMTLYFKAGKIVRVVFSAPPG